MVEGEGKKEIKKGNKKEIKKTKSKPRSPQLSICVERGFVSFFVYNCLVETNSVH